jgi:hypothetical protein
MIIYELTCIHAHRFEGWFASGDDYASQRERGLVTCPVCDDGHVERVPSARVSVPKGASVPTASTSSAVPQSPNRSTDVTAKLPAELLAKLREVVKQTENVGTRFPEEARRIHYEEAPARPIRGQASPDDAKALHDEGIDFSSVPPFLLPDSH